MRGQQNGVCKMVLKCLVRNIDARELEDGGLVKDSSIKDQRMEWAIYMSNISVPTRLKQTTHQLRLVS